MAWAELQIAAVCGFGCAASEAWRWLQADAGAALRASATSSTNPAATTRNRMLTPARSTSSAPEFIVTFAAPAGRGH